MLLFTLRIIIVTRFRTALQPMVVAVALGAFATRFGGLGGVRFGGHRDLAFLAGSPRSNLVPQNGQNLAIA